jgi:hypothetical protein
VIRHENVEVVKHKPQLIVRWANDQSKQEQPKLVANCGSEVNCKEDEKEMNLVQ